MHDEDGPTQATRSGPSIQSNDQPEVFQPREYIKIIPKNEERQQRGDRE
ncbi:hypothetical protein [Shouchella shacheensis]|nr:hypothetical protein [Shouchella shacheensis]